MKIDLNLCNYCRTPLTSYERYCMQCGKENPLFDMEEYNKEHTTPYSEELKKCSTGHTLTFEERMVRIGTDDDPPLPYCDVCGKTTFSALVS